MAEIGWEIYHSLMAILKGTGFPVNIEGGMDVCIPAVDLPFLILGLKVNSRLKLIKFST